MHSKTHARILCDSILKEDLFNGECLDYMHTHFATHICLNNPYRRAPQIARVMDINGAAFNLRALGVLRKVEFGCDNETSNLLRKKGDLNNWLASRNRIIDAMSRVEAYARNVIPYSAVDPNGPLDGVVFEFLPLLTYVLKTYKLYEITTTIGGVCIAVTLDSADLSRNITHVTAGIKIVDPRAVDPISGIPIGLDGSKKLQSRELCIPFKIVLAKDNKNLYDTQFTDFFAFFKLIGEEDHGCFKKFNIVSPQDCLSFWKTLKRGGACRNKTEFYIFVVSTDPYKTS